MRALFSTSQLPKVVWHCGFLTLLTWKCASRYNGVRFFISHLASWLRARRFSEITFGPSGATNHWKNTVNCDFPTFRAPASSFFWLSPSFRAPASSFFWLSPSLIVSLLDFSSLTLPTSAFQSLHIVGSLTSKLPSMICCYDLFLAWFCSYGFDTVSLVILRWFHLLFLMWVKIVILRGFGCYFHASWDIFIRACGLLCTWLACFRWGNANSSMIWYRLGKTQVHPHTRIKIVSKPLEDHIKTTTTLKKSTKSQSRGCFCFLSWSSTLWGTLRKALRSQTIPKPYQNHIQIHIYINICKP